MSTKHHIIKERFDILIDVGRGGVSKKQFELDKNAKFLLGISLTSSRDDLLYYRGTQKILVNDIELFPENYESKLLFSGLNVPPDLRMVSVGAIPTGNGKLDVWYTDTESKESAFIPYRVSIYTYSTANNPNEEVQ